MRRHGWELPYHPLQVSYDAHCFASTVFVVALHPRYLLSSPSDLVSQVVAIAVFLALAFAYYVFFVPFVGSRMLQLFGISAYSPLVCFGLPFPVCHPIEPQAVVISAFRLPIRTLFELH